MSKPPENPGASVPLPESLAAALSVAAAYPKLAIDLSEGAAVAEAVAFMTKPQRLPLHRCPDCGKLTEGVMRLIRLSPCCLRPLDRGTLVERPDALADIDILPSGEIPKVDGKLLVGEVLERWSPPQPGTGHRCPACGTRNTPGTLRLGASPCCLIAAGAVDEVQRQVAAAIAKASGQQYLDDPIAVATDGTISAEQTVALAGPVPPADPGLDALPVPDESAVVAEFHRRLSRPEFLPSTDPRIVSSEAAEAGRRFFSALPFSVDPPYRTLNPKELAAAARLYVWDRALWRSLKPAAVVRLPLSDADLALLAELRDFPPIMSGSKLGLQIMAAFPGVKSLRQLRRAVRWRRTSPRRGLVTYSSALGVVASTGGCRWIWELRPGGDSRSAARNGDRAPSTYRRAREAMRAAERAAWEVLRRPMRCAAIPRPRPNAHDDQVDALALALESVARGQAVRFSEPAPRAAGAGIGPTIRPRSRGAP